MAYLFGAGTADHIAVSGLTPWTTRMLYDSPGGLAAEAACGQVHEWAVE
jgi:hypothetical protein